MKKIILACCAISLFVVSCSNNASETTDKATDTTTAADNSTKKEEAFVPVDSATSMKNWMAFSTPGTEHTMLAKSNGTWTSDMTMWEYDGAAPQKTTGTAVNKMILGGRYQQSTHTATMMGMPFEGVSTLGYNNATKKYESSWVDNMGTGVMHMEGTWDDASKSVTFTGTCINPSTMKECEMKEVFTIVDDNTQKMEMWGQDPKTGKQFKAMEIMLTRKK